MGLFVVDLKEVNNNKQNEAICVYFWWPRFAVMSISASESEIVKANLKTGCVSGGGVVCRVNVIAVVSSRHLFGKIHYRFRGGNWLLSGCVNYVYYSALVGQFSNVGAHIAHSNR